MKNNELREKEIKEAEYRGFMQSFRSKRSREELQMWSLMIVQEIDTRIAFLKAELVRGLEGKKKIYDGGSGEKELLFIDPTAVEGYNVGIDEAIELVKKT